MQTLHYIYDPLCGWCYAAAPLLDALTQEIPELSVKLHAGGLFSQQTVTSALAEHIRTHDARIHTLTGQIFGGNYLNGLLDDSDTLFDSAMVIAGILAVESLSMDSAIPMLKLIQNAHYQSGMKVVKRETLCTLAAALGLDANDFLHAYDAVSGQQTWAHISSTQKIMAENGARGFPTFLLQNAENEFHTLAHSECFGNPQGFVVACRAHLLMQ